MKKQVFIVKMWRLLIYETEAKKIGLVSKKLFYIKSSISDFFFPILQRTINFFVFKDICEICNFFNVENVEFFCPLIC